MGEARDTFQVLEIPGVVFGNEQYPSRRGHGAPNGGQRGLGAAGETRGGQIIESGWE